MQNYRFGLIGFALAIIVGALALYWSSQAPEHDSPSPKLESGASSQVETPPEPAQTVNEKPADVAPEAKEQAADVMPVFDILRVEPDGSVVIAGKAAPDAEVEVVAGSAVLGKATAGPTGDFVVILDKPLKPGDHQLVLRATGADGKAATSAQTAIVSVPATPDGQVLALVEAPGQASRLITRPAAPQKAEAGDANAPAQLPAIAQNAPIAIEAVEIDGNMVFVAGRARDGNRVIVHANDIVLGAGPVTAEGRFLIQSKQALAVGDYVIRAELLDSMNRILATARVPFHREAGAALAAVAPKPEETQNESAANTADVANETNANETEAAALQKVEGSVIIRRGDNLWTISKRTYGRGARYTTIYLANRDQIRNPDLILPGQVFTMPKEPLDDEEVKKLLNEQSQEGAKQ